MQASGVKLTRDHGVTVVAFSVDADQRANPELVRQFFSTRFLDELSGETLVVINLQGVATLDSACLGPLVQKLREVQEARGRMALAAVHAPALREIFALTRFDKVFPIYEDAAAAVAALRAVSK